MSSMLWNMCAVLHVKEMMATVTWWTQAEAVNKCAGVSTPGGLTSSNVAPPC